MTKSDSALLTERHGKVAVVTLNRPEKRNALSETLWRALRETFAGMDAEVRAVVLRGAGSHFCAGLDLSEHQDRDPIGSIDISRYAHATLDAIQFGRPVISAMQGAVIGGGLEVATATHIRVADRTAFYQLPEARRGFYVGGGASVRVARIIGADRMAEMMLTGRRYDAEAGDRLGLSHYLVDEGTAFDKAMELAEQVAGNAPFANYLIVQALPRIANMASADGLWTESIAQALSLVPDDARAGIAAFLEKRKIDF